MADKNRVRFGLKNVHYAVRTVTAGVSSWATPVEIPGAVNLDLAQDGSMDPFYADNVTYYISQANNGYSGSLEVAKVPESMWTDIWGYSKDSNNVFFEDVDTEPKTIALLFQIDGDDSDTLHALLNVTINRPNIGSSTIEASKTPQTQTMDINAAPEENGRVRAWTSEAATGATLTNWFTTVYSAPTP